VKFTERDLSPLAGMDKTGGKVEILLVESNFNKGGKPDARKRK
jgi:hypothetical protein